MAMVPDESPTVVAPPLDQMRVLPNLQVTYVGTGTGKRVVKIESVAEPGRWTEITLDLAEWEAYSLWRARANAGDTPLTRADLARCIPSLADTSIDLLASGTPPPPGPDEPPMYQQSPVGASATSVDPPPAMRTPTTPPKPAAAAQDDELVLVFDTETTGLVNERAPAEDPSQPELVQLAALLVDGRGREWAVVSLVVEPACGVPQGAANVHGLTDGICRRVGVAPQVAVAVFERLAQRARRLVAHNIAFDDTVIAAAFARCGRSRADRLLTMPRVCTMQLTTPLLNLPASDRMVRAGLPGPKPPKLAETYRFLFGEDLAGAHNALVDARACARIYRELRRRGDV